MENDKQSHLKLAKSVWEHYLDGKSKSYISKELGISRYEVIAIIKYTTYAMFADEKALKEHCADYMYWKYSDRYIYRNGVKTNEMFTYKRLSELYLKKNRQLRGEIKQLKNDLETCESAKLSIMGRQIL